MTDPAFFPPEFDAGFYRKCKPYLAGMPDALLEQEFREFGIRSGSPGSFFCYRENIVGFLAKIGKLILEIGPGGHPDFTGNKVKYLDIFTTEELRERYSSSGGTPPQVDYTVNDLVAGAIPDKFDVVYSAHNFEHQVNPVKHIASVAGILKSGGCFVAVIPDKRFTFDYFRNTSTLAEILGAPDSQTEHSLVTRLNRFNRTHNNCPVHWFGEHGQSEKTEESILAEYSARDDNAFLSLHAHVFDPDSFRQIFGLLSERKLIALELLRVYNTPFLRNEFVTVFRKTDDEPAESSTATDV